MTKRVYSQAEYAKVMALVAEHKSLAEIEAATGVGRGAVYRMRSGQWQGKATSRELTGAAELTRALQPYLDDGHDLDSLTVLTPSNDPFRCDTEAGHRDAAWLRDTLASLGVDLSTEVRRHLRGLHYALIGQTRPDGSAYPNDFAGWSWLKAAAKAARWLGYVPFASVTDQRNSEPVIRIGGPGEPWGDITTDADVIAIPAVESFVPRARVVTSDTTREAQPRRLVIIGEKSSLEPVLGPVADAFQADLLLPTGELSDTLIHRLASAAADDGRPLVVFYFADCDPAGWQMAVSVSRKLQAFGALLGGLDFQVHRVALTPDQVRELGLPSTPLKPTEKRGDKWQAQMGTAQTEIDALAALRPGDLDQIARNAMAPYFDATLRRRTGEAISAWRREAQRVVDDGLDGDRAELISAGQAKLSEARELVDEVRDSLRTAATAGDLPPFGPPEPVLPVDLPGSEDRNPLVSSEWEFPEQCRALKDSKAYEDDDGDE